MFKIQPWAILTAAMLAAALAAPAWGQSAAGQAAEAIGGVVERLAGGSEEERAAREEAAAAAEAAATATALQTIENVIGAIEERNAQAEELRAAIEDAETDVDREEASAALQALNAEIAELNGQIEALATGVSGEDADPAAAERFELREELEQLIQPFVLMLKSATENARAIETLKRTALLAERSASSAETALTSLGQIAAITPEGSPAAERVAALTETWTERLTAAQDRGAAAQRQLEARLATVEDPRDSAAEALQGFFSERGRNLVVGLSAFFGVFFALRLIKRGGFAALGAPRNRSVPARVAGFVFDGLTLLAAFGVMLAIFNMYNDWLLTGLTVLVLLALGWFVLRSGPHLFEQVTMLLNLGAVQEGERVMFAGAPWRVKKLDFYSELENPLLRGGSFTVPIRELRGLYSRPMDEGEAWFPSAEGDYVELGDGLWGQVVFQSPEMVQIRDVGGSVTTFTLETYLAQSPRNLSQGFKTSAFLDIDPAHFAHGAPDALAEAAQAHLNQRFGFQSDLAVDAALVGSGALGLRYELTARAAGSAAPSRDDIRDALGAAAVACAAQRGWRLATAQSVSTPA